MFTSAVVKSKTPTYVEVVDAIFYLLRSGGVRWRPAVWEVIQSRHREQCRREARETANPIGPCESIAKPRCRECV